LFVGGMYLLEGTSIGTQRLSQCVSIVTTEAPCLGAGCGWEGREEDVELRGDGSAKSSGESEAGGLNLSLIVILWERGKPNGQINVT